MSTTMVARLSGIPPQGHSFEATECSHRKRRMSGVVGEKSYFGPTLTVRGNTMRQTTPVSYS